MLENIWRTSSFSAVVILGGIHFIWLQFVYNGDTFNSLRSQQRKRLSHGINPPVCVRCPYWWAEACSGNSHFSPV